MASIGVRCQPLNSASVWSCEMPHRETPFPLATDASEFADSVSRPLRRRLTDASEALTFSDSASASAPSGPILLSLKSSYDRE